MGKRRFDPNRPDGVQIFMPTLQPAGAYFKQPGVQRFVMGKRLALELKREPKNPHDANAIKIVGIVRGLLFKRRYDIGYLPAEIARKIVQGGFWPNVGADLRMVQWGEYTTIEFDLYGPKGQKKKFDQT
jgi:hypothetical protein